MTILSLIALFFTSAINTTLPGIISTLKYGLIVRLAVNGGDIMIISIVTIA